MYPSKAEANCCQCSAAPYTLQKCKGYVIALFIHIVLTHLSQYYFKLSPHINPYKACKKNSNTSKKNEERSFRQNSLCLSQTRLLALLINSKERKVTSNLLLFSILIYEWIFIKQSNEGLTINTAILKFIIIA